MITTSKRRQRRRRGFTLVELLIVITIMLLLMSITVYSVRSARDTDRVTSGASRVQSFLNGARDRAIFERRPIGVRLFTDTEDDPATASLRRRSVASMVYIDPVQVWSQGTVELQRPDLDDNNAADADTVNILEGTGSAWWELKRRGLLVDGLTVEIGEFRSPIDTSLIDVGVAKTDVPERLILQIPYLAKGTTSRNSVTAFTDGGPSTYRLFLPPRILPVEPALLPDSVVIDLDGSRLPPAWTAASNTEGFSQFMDVVFSPRGTLIGSAASQGVIHLYVCDKAEAVSLKEQWIDQFGFGFTDNVRFVPADDINPSNPNSTWVGDLADPANPYTPGDRRLVSIFAQTGAVSVTEVDSTDFVNNANPLNLQPDGLADDPFRLAEGVN